ncbi:MAG: TIGR02206 family membrane protein [Anaerolineae bacterium]|nr:TIGR02206 family membrane protein [Phycisphaerae bacterium]
MPIIATPMDIRLSFSSAKLSVVDDSWKRSFPAWVEERARELEDAPVHAFRPFSQTHLIVVIAFAALCTISIVAARRVRPRSRILAERIFSLACIPLFIANNHELWLNTHQFDVRRSLPLHVCDLAALFVPLALALNWRPARVVLYYFGLLLSSQGFITPDLDEGPAHLQFWGFWLLHAAVVGAAIYDIGARGFRPMWRDLRLAIAIGVIYVIAMVVLDVAIGANYGYVGPTKPELPTVIDMLGPFPWRVFVMSALGIIVTAIATIPWVLVRKRNEQSSYHERKGVDAERGNCA